MREQLLKHLQGGEVFVPLDELLPKIPYEKLGERPENLPYSFYELFYHIVYAQSDILAYCCNKNYKAPKWPKDYWPKQQKPQSKAEWENLQKTFKNSQKALTQLLGNENKNLSETVPTNDKHTLLREVLLVIEHNAYHTGQLVIIARLLGVYKS
ncbi:DinB family protein [Mesonia maritima]|uniref:Damage-inducible protein DinB n=1 Tax=Mesonia maritima TaxID=1793873 RepID=A0ABU1K8S0_9FLAO|nr:DinB family protein [Mesonia maritima]MDR6300902.1 putative damage-inducible protein DinB [Mesonia maritima]